MQRVILKADCPVAALNELFPGGVPVVSVEPTTEINQQPCLEFPLSVGNRHIPLPMLERIMTILQQDKCPIALTFSVSMHNFVPLDPDWVQTVVEEPNG